MSVIGGGADQVHGGARGGDADAGHVRDDVQVPRQARLAHEQVRAHPLEAPEQVRLLILSVLCHKDMSWSVQQAGHACVQDCDVVTLQEHRRLLVTLRARREHGRTALIKQ